MINCRGDLLRVPLAVAHCERRRKLYDRTRMTLLPWLTAFLSGVLLVSQVGAVGFRVETGSGQFIEGTWAGTTGSVIRIDDGSTIREIPVDQVVALRPVSEVDSSSGPPMNVTLTDGTSICAQELGMDETSIRIEPRRQKPVNIPIRQIRSIRFRLGGAATDPQWLGLVEQESRSDLMVIRRGNEQLDPIEGVVVGLNREKLQFELDGEKIEAPLDRLEGVLFRSGDSPNSESKVKVADMYGSTFLAARLEPNDSSDVVEVMLPGQGKHSIPIQQIQFITWTSGRVLLAADTAAASEMKPYLSTKLPAGLLKAWFGPIADGEDLIASAGGGIEYRVEEGFQTLAGSVGRDEAVAGGGTVLIRILVDDQLKWEQSLVDSTAKGFRIPVIGARRVRLEVLAGKDGDVGDQVRFLIPRLLK